MNFKFIEGRKTCNKVVEFRGVRVSYKEVVYNKGEGGGVGVVSEKHGVVVSEKPCWVRRETNKTELGQEAGLGEARDSLENIAEEEGFAVGVTEERKEAKFCEGGERDGRWTTHRFGQI